MMSILLIFVEADPGDDIGSGGYLEERQTQSGLIIRKVFRRSERTMKLQKQIPEKLIAFMTKVLNMWVQAKIMATWIWQKWKACEVKELPIDIRNRPVYVGSDMSSKIDLTSVAFIIPYQSELRDAQGKAVVCYILWTHSLYTNCR